MPTAPDPPTDPRQAAEHYRAAVGRRLQQVRRERKLSQEALADLVGLHRAYMGHLEQGRRNFPIDTLYRLARALDVEPADLLPPTTQVTAGGREQ